MANNLASRTSGVTTALKPSINYHNYQPRRQYLNTHHQQVSAIIDDEELIAAQLSDFQRCVVQIRRISWNRLGKLESAMKRKFVSDMLCQYFKKEDCADVFEGFLRLIIEFGQSPKPHEHYVKELVFNTFYQHVIFPSRSEEMRRFILTKTYSHDSKLFRNALSIVTKMKVRLLKQIAYIFSLKMEMHRQLVIDSIKLMLAEKSMINAILWIDFFEYRDEFDFEEILCNLYVEDRFQLMLLFIGPATTRRHRFIRYLDHLLGLRMGRTDADTMRRVNHSSSELSKCAPEQLERVIMADAKKLEKTIIRFIKYFNIGGVADLLAENTLVARCNECLIYFYHRWTTKELTDEEYDEYTIMGMMSDAFVRQNILLYLCKRGHWRKALYFAVAMDLSNKEYPLQLLHYSIESPDELSRIRMEVAEEKIRREKVDELEAFAKCEVMGVPVFMVDTWEEIVELISRLPDEQLVGIDAEWAPNFLSLCETVALIQVAVSDKIYLIDIPTLKTKLNDDQWMTFFKALLCEKNNKKIGFDFGNDLRIMRRTFPFIETLANEYQNIICLFRLFSQVSTNPEASLAVFGKETIDFGINLSEISKFFLDIKLDKSEQQGNWIRRPLRHDQKKYAALDAYCLIKCFRIAASRIITIKNKALQAELQTAALISEKRVVMPEAADGAELIENEVPESYTDSVNYNESNADFSVQFDYYANNQ